MPYHEHNIAGSDAGMLEEPAVDRTVTMADGWLTDGRRGHHGRQQQDQVTER
jgi:hypothetical protein